jgi:hypothetical protein
MTQEEKSLLLKDLCARLPYGVKCKIALYKTAFNTLGIVEDKVKLDSPVYDEGDDWWDITEIKPYLRPMSSMTEEEIGKYKCLNDALDENYEVHIDNAYPAFDWLNAHHLDYRGLIDKGLALEATEGMYGIND